ncbi:MAG TPA: hypothetical protein VHW43_04130, partial [Puia sp.]|nr:hypothetical protein [Puia sp.]
MPNTQITGEGPVVGLASGSTASVGTVFNPGNGYDYYVLSNSSIENLETGQITAAPSSGQTGQTSPDGLYANTQITGSGPLVTLASGSSAPAGTIFNPGNGTDYEVGQHGEIIN